MQLLADFRIKDNKDRDVPMKYIKDYTNNFVPVNKYYIYFGFIDSITIADSETEEDCIIKPSDKDFDWSEFFESYGEKIFGVVESKRYLFRVDACELKLYNTLSFSNIDRDVPQLPNTTYSTYKDNPYIYINKDKVTGRHIIEFNSTVKLLDILLYYEDAYIIYGDTLTILCKYPVHFKINDIDKFKLLLTKIKVLRS